MKRFVTHDYYLVKSARKFERLNQTSKTFEFFFRRLIEIITFVVFNYRENESKFERSKEFVS